MKACVYCVIAFLLGAAVARGQVSGEPQGRREAADGVEVLTRGPVHEAFAGTITFNPEPGILAPSPPPEMIEELPPEQRPEGDNVAWIPGYWAWDDERSDFLWVSGIWRNLPPGRQWVPGYWGDSGREYQWTSGYWADATVREVEYLPAPPASVEVGPNIAATSANQTWLPGCWIWRQTRYAWRPGYWAAGQPDWVWVPASYAWTPRGYVFVDGYYDYSVANRGVLFAPVYFSSNVYSRRGYSYSPVTVINPAVFASQLFLRPNYQHYYFGDYYAASYSTAGFYPWFSYNSRHYGYDPIYAHARWQHQQDRDWERQVQADFQHRRDHEEARPPRTWAAQTALVASQVNSTDKSFVVAASLAQLVNSKGSPLRFQPVAQEERQRLVEHGHEMQEFRQERQKQEAKAAVTSAANPSQQPEPARVKFSRSPIVAKSANQFGQDQALPKRHEVLKPDLPIEPTPIQPPPQPPPEVERPAPPQPQPPPEVERPAPPQPQPPPEVERPAPPRPMPPPEVERPETNRD